MKDHLENNTQYTLDELVTWFSARSRICSTKLWQAALKGKTVFEVGDYTYRSTHIKDDIYLLHAVESNSLITPHQVFNVKKMVAYILILGAVATVAVSLWANL